MLKVEQNAQIKKNGDKIRKKEEEEVNKWYVGSKKCNQVYINYWYRDIYWFNNGTVFLKKNVDIY